LGIPKNAREEKLWRRRLSRAENEQVARLYRQLVLNEPVEPLVQLKGLRAAHEAIDKRAEPVIR
jgi:hypothetical protein